MTTDAIETEITEDEAPAPPTIDELRAELAELQAEDAERQRAEAAARRDAALRSWEAARERSARDLSAWFGKAAANLLDRHFDPAGLGDLMAAVAPSTDKAMRQRIEALTDRAVSPRPSYHPASRRAGAISQQIARLEDEQRRMARMARSTQRGLDADATTQEQNR